VTIGLCRNEPNLIVWKNTRAGLGYSSKSLIRARELVNKKVYAGP